MLLSNFIKELSENFRHNTPFPHLVVEGLFSPVLLELMNEDFDLLKEDDFLAYRNLNEKKLGTRPFTRLGHACELYYSTVNSARFINFLAGITGIDGLITDPGLSGGSLHQILTGGKFSVHLDFNQYEVTKLENCLVFFTYLNKDWLPAYGGALELWNAEEEKCEVEVLPVFGRSVLFAHSSKSLNGHPTPVEAPNRRPRMPGGIPAYRASTHCIPFGLQEVITVVTMIVSLKEILRCWRRSFPPACAYVTSLLLSPRAC